MLNSTNFEEMLKNSPKSFKKLKEFIILGLLNMQKLMKPEDMKGVTLPDVNEFVTDQVVTHMLQSNIRSLYEFFDSNNIWVQIHHSADGWNYNENKFPPTFYLSRLEAEIAGFTYALQKLEEKL